MTELDPNQLTAPILESQVVENMPAWAETMIGLGLLVLLAILANFIVKQVILRFALKLLQFHEPSPAPVAARLANIVPAIIVAKGIGLVAGLPEGLVTVVQNVVTAFVILTIVLAINSGLNFVNAMYRLRPDAASRPIKGYIQLAKILLFMSAAILIVAALMEQSPLLLLSGMGAMAAVIMLVFKDTILSLVASVQLTSNDMLRVGDWIEMPQLNADGDVVDIALHTVKVQNFDKTITTIPTHRLISDSFKNWRGMKDAGGRRIKRPLFLDQNSIRFLNDDEVAKFRRFSLLDKYLAAKDEEIREWNKSTLGDAADPVNARKLTNVGTFRAYVIAYLRSHPRVASKGYTLLVRQLAPTGQGLPLEVYCFAGTTEWPTYEAIQSDIFDHLIAILPEFGLRLFQEPSGLDVMQNPTGAAL